jgi:hypothetical protein
MVPLILTALAADPSLEPAPRFAAKLSKSDDKFVSRDEKGVAVWVITSPKGISGGEVTLTSGDAPKKIVVRLNGFTTLESFGVIVDGTWGMARGFDPSGPNPVRYVDATGRATTDPKKAAGTIQVSAVKGGIEVTLTFKKPGKKWKLSWIDAHRK